MTRTCTHYCGRALRYVHLEWMQRTIDLDAIWDALGDTATADDDVRSVYFVREVRTNRVKVGFTSNLDQRTRSHQCGNAGDLAVAFELKTPNYREVEASIKKYLTDGGLHIRGEWFFLHTDCDYGRIIATSTASSSTDSTTETPASRFG